MEKQTQPKIDVLEHGMGRDGAPTTMKGRLFMQLHAFGGCQHEQALVETLQRAGIEAVLYKDINDPRGVGLLTMSEDPTFFVSSLPSVLNADPFRSLSLKPQFTMLGRSYSTGFEPDLEDWLLMKPRRTVLNAAWPWAVWYPLRRTGAFAALPENEQKSILREHGGIGRLYGEEDLAHDVRLACHGIDGRDNEFVIGLVGKELYPLSHLVQTMRKTRQTSEFIQSMGPFFVGYALWQSPAP
ncbi:MAG: chlorite dismutase family protein [Acidobacteriota bacterium]